jgi:hypothetical protein
LADPSLFSQSGASDQLGGISDNGRYVVFTAGADNLVIGDNNDNPDILERDLQTGVTSLVSITPSGTPGNSPSQSPKMTPDGRFVLFQSAATDLVPGVSISTWNLYVRDLVGGPRRW